MKELKMHGYEPDYDLDVPTTFVVSQRCLDEGDKKSQSGCPVALAIENAGGCAPIVYEDGICSFTYLMKRYVGVSKSLPQKVLDYDNGREVKPFCFSLKRVKSFYVEDNWEEYENLLGETIKGQGK